MIRTQPRRRKEKKTDYKKRLALVKSGKPRLVIRRSLKETHLQIVEYFEDGDRTIFEMSTKILRKYGWAAHCGSVPAAYLVGMLLALRAKEKIKEIVTDTGLFSSERMMAAILGTKHGGLHINFNAPVNMERISGKHIAEYASKISGTERYKKQFSNYIKNGIKPEDITQHFEEVKSNIMKEFSAN